MRKILCVVLLIILSFVLVACGETVVTTDLTRENETESHIYEDIANNDADEPPAEYTNNDSDTEAGSEESTQAAGFALVYNGVTIQMDDDIEYLLTKLDEPVGIFEAPSCAFDGIDRIFGFQGIQIHTYPDGDLDRVHTVSFLNDGITTISGITLGDSWSDVVAIYGNNYTQDTGMFTYTIDRTTLSFFVEDDMVFGIIFGLIMD